MSGEPAPAAGRIATLDITRGVAVMGILSVNIVAMAMIQIAYFYPPARGFDGVQDKLLWLVNFLLIDGKLRSLFSIMFGASLLLVIERAVAAARSPAKTHYARMIVLLGFGYLHWLLLWWGDILTHYAAVGMVAFLFWKLKPKTLLIIACVGFLIHSFGDAFFATRSIVTYEQVQAGTADAKEREQAARATKNFFPDSKTLAEDDAKHETPLTHARVQLADDGPLAPLDLGPLWFETLSLMLLGMALYKSGFLTGALPAERYRRHAMLALGTGLAGYAAAALFTWSKGYAPPYHLAAYGGFTSLLRPWMATGYAALIILLAQRGMARGPLATRLAAVGRMAFSNYLGCTIIGTLIFFGFGGDLYQTLSRFEAWLFVPVIWGAMLLWSKWWLDRFHYGPLEWLWRSLARWEVQPMTKRGPAPALAV